MLISPTKALPLALQLHDGSAIMYPLAHVYDQAGAAVTGSPFTMSHVANGFYTNTSYTVVGGDQKLRAVYIIYSDIGHTIESTFHGRALDEWDVETQVETINTKLGTPVASVSADIAAIQTKLGTPAAASVSADVANIYSRIGVPVAASISVDIANVQTKSNTIDTKLGTPVASVSADIAAVKSDTTGLRTDYSTVRATKIDNLDVALSSRASSIDLASLDTKIGTPFTTIAGDIDDVGTNEGAHYTIITSKLGTPVVTISDDIASVKSDSSGLRSDYTTVRSSKLDNLDIAVSTRSSAANLTALDTKIGVPATSIAGDIAALSSLTPASVATAIWGALRSDHIAPGTFGEANQGIFSQSRANDLDLLITIYGNLLTVLLKLGTPATGSLAADLAGVSANVLTVRSKTDLLSFDGTELRTKAVTVVDKNGYSLTTDEKNLLVDLVFDELLSGHIATGSAGKALIDAQQSVDPAVIAAAVWAAARVVNNTVGSFGEALQGILSAARATNLDSLDAPVSGLETEAIANIRYNSLLSDITTAITNLGTINTKLGTPAGASVSADIAAVKSETVKIGTPTGVSIAADIQSVKGDTVKIGTPVTTISSDIAAIQTKLGTPAGASVSADIASVKTTADKIGAPVTGTLAGDVAAVQTKLGTPTLSIASDINAVSGQVTAVQTKLGTPAGASISVDIADVKTDTTTLTSRLTATRAAKIDNLDVFVSSRVAQSGYNSDITTINVKLDAIQAGIGAIPNNTSAVVIVPPVMIRPQSGSTPYKFFVNLFDITSGVPTDADAGVTVAVQTVSGATVVGPTTMTHLALGQYSYSYPVGYTDTEQTLYVFFSYLQNAIPFEQIRVTEVQEWESKLDTLLTRLTPTRATNLDNLDVAISTRASEANAITRETATQLAIALVQADTDAIQAVLGTPIGVSMSADLQAINSWVTKIGNPTTGTVSGDIEAVKVVADRIGIPTSSSIATDIAALVTRIGTPATASIAGDVANIKSDTVKIGTPSGGSVATALSDIRNKMGTLAGAATLEGEITSIDLSPITTVIGTPGTGTLVGDVAAVQTKLGTPTAGTVSDDLTTIRTATNKIGTPAGASVSADIAAVQTKLGTPANGTVSQDVADLSTATLADLSSLSTLVAVTNTKIGTPVGTVSSDLVAIANSVNLIPITPVLQNDSRLAYLDTPVSTRATPANVIGSMSGLDLVEIVGILDSENTELVGVIEAVG